jgi:hypothetical protein
MNLAWYDLDAALGESLSRLNKGQLLDLELKIHKALARWEARRPVLDAIRLELGHVVTPEEEEWQRANAEIIAHALDGVPSSPAMDDEEVLLRWEPKPARAKSVYAQLAEENRERAQFWQVHAKAG